MQIKKRAKSAKFGKKIEPVEEKKEEKKDPTVENKPPVVSIPDKEEVIVKEENKGEKQAQESAISDPEVKAVEEKNDLVNQEEVHVKEEVVNESGVEEAIQPVNSVNQEVMNETPAKEIAEQRTPESDNAYVVQTEIKKNLLRYFILVAVISFLVGLVSMAAISFFLQKKPFELPFITRKVEIMPSPVPTITVEPTKVVEVNLAEYNIEVLNGSEIAGEASKLKTELITGGFKVVSIGNAEKSDYRDTIISVKKKVSAAFLEKLKDNLKKTYTLAPDAKTSLPETSEADVVITIGSGRAGL